MNITIEMVLLEEKMVLLEEKMVLLEERAALLLQVAHIAASFRGQDDIRPKTCH